MITSNKTFEINPLHNYYACPVVRPNSQLLMVRLEWEATNDSDSESEEDIENNFSLSMVYFANMQYILIGLERSAHKKVVKIAEELNLKVIHGYPLSQQDKKISHFPIQCAADSIYTIEGFLDVNDPNQLIEMKKKESKLVQAYLESKFTDNEVIEDD